MRQKETVVKICVEYRSFCPMSGDDDRIYDSWCMEATNRLAQGHQSL